MITQIEIKNFRSIKNQTVPLKKLNILYGHNGSGKSSIMYAPYVFRNFFVNPNQRLNSLFNLGFINLGGYEGVVYNQLLNKDISISLEMDLNDSSLERVSKKMLPFNYHLNLSNYGRSSVAFEWWNIEQRILLDFPSTLTEKAIVDFNKTKIIWNGATFDTTVYNAETLTLISRFNKAYELIKNIEVISVRRGFFKAIFSTEFDDEESSFAIQIREEGLDFDIKIDRYFSKLFNKNFRFVAIPGSTSFYLRTHNKEGFTTDLVNEGFGVNQTVYMLIKILKKNTSLAFIEEPEIHLHPSAQSQLVDVFTEIIQKENKQIFLTTHSENIVSSVLRKIADGELSKDDVQFYLAKYENDETQIIPQQVNNKGQIEGGLMNFMEAELSNLKSILGI